MKPQLFVISRPTLDESAVASYLETIDSQWQRTSGASAGEEIVEIAGRICYLSFGEHQSARSNSDYIRNLIGRGHESVLEHASWGFVLTGISRAFTHQFVRHRVGFSYSQLSQQYHEDRDSPAIPPNIVEDVPDLHAFWQKAVNSAREAYVEILDRLQKESPEPFEAVAKREHRRRIRSAARSVLPEATATTIFFSANARALRHFLILRGSIAGDDEMRAVSVLLFQAISREAPALFADFKVETIEGIGQVVSHRMPEIDG